MHQRLLAALSTGWIVDALGVSRAAVSNWRRGSYPLIRQDQVEQAVRALLPETQEAPPPQWAAGLTADVPAIRKVVEANAVELETLRVVLEAIEGGLLQSGADPVDGPARPLSGRRRGRS